MANPNLQHTYSLAIDGNEANVANRVGSNVYAFELIKALYVLLQSRHDIKVTVLLSHNPNPDLPRSRKNWRYKVVTPAKLWTQWTLPIHLFLNRQEYDVFFTPGHYAPRISSVPYVSSVMDLAFLEYGDQFNPRDLLQLTNWTRYSVKHAKKVVAISEYTKSDVISHYHRAATDIIVAPPAVDMPRAQPRPSEGAQVCQKFGIVDPYLIHVGTIQPRKNIERLIEAFELMSDQLATRSGRQPKRFQLVLVGKIGWLADSILERVKASRYHDRIVLTNFVTEAEKRALLKFAQASVNIGLHEGFGIPPLEAMHLGTIPVVSNTTSLPEVVRNAGLLVNPDDVAEVATKLAQAVTLPAKERAKLRKAARDQIKKFTWANSAERVLSTLLEVADTYAK